MSVYFANTEQIVVVHPHSGHLMVIEHSDSGHGLPPDVYPVVFTPSSCYTIPDRSVGGWGSVGVPISIQGNEFRISEPNLARETKERATLLNPQIHTLSQGDFLFIHNMAREALIHIT